MRPAVICLESALKTLTAIVSSHKHSLFAGQNHTYRKNRMPLFFSFLARHGITPLHAFHPCFSVFICGCFPPCGLSAPNKYKRHQRFADGVFDLSPFDIVSHSMRIKSRKRVRSNRIVLETPRRGSFFSLSNGTTPQCVAGYARPFEKSVFRPPSSGLAPSFASQAYRMPSSAPLRARLSRFDLLVFF